MTASTTTPRHSTNARNGASHRRGDAATGAAAVAPGRGHPAPARPPARPTPGARPSKDVTANPTRVSAQHDEDEHRQPSARRPVPAGWHRRSSPAKNQPQNTYSTRSPPARQAISAVKWANDSPAALKASRLVRLDTGSSSDAVLDRCAVAYACGRAGTASVRAVASTTGVSSTTVASRLSTAVVAAATTKTVSQQPVRLPTGAGHRHPRRVEQALVVAELASTSTAARKPTTGSSLPRPRRRARRSRRPPPQPAAGTATTASGQPLVLVLSAMLSSSR